MRNKIQDLADHLFAQMERLSDETLTAEQLTTEIRRAGAIDRIANRITDVGHLALSAARIKHDLPVGTSGPRLLGLDGEA
ncbi:MAG: hypothetical protein KA204_05435 [Chromatiaceae bacterium]|jgi:hypothetical protein|nr:hypothetical protein [Chromatiaceae bacterium]MBP6807181.1 hypothetical protein [Chromatiaceae bacterium]MBP8289118.1 hypothetical protein [Chromatiaceae bacterium]